MRKKKTTKHKSSKKMSVASVFKNKPWEKYDPDAHIDTGYTVPLNDYDLEILRALKVIEDRSQTKIATRLLSHALRMAIKAAQKNQRAIGEITPADKGD